MDYQQIITLLLPLIAMLVSYGLQQVHWPARANTAIASSTVLLSAAASLFIQHKLTGNVMSDLGYVLATATALQSESFTPLQQYLRANFPSSSTGVGETGTTPDDPPTAVQPRVPPTVADWNKRIGQTPNQ